MNKLREDIFVWLLCFGILCSCIQEDPDKINRSAQEGPGKIKSSAQEGPDKINSSAQDSRSNLRDNPIQRITNVSTPKKEDPQIKESLVL